MGTTAPLGVGDLVGGKYRLEREIGAGGMGIVFAAMHVGLEQRVALKFLFIEAAQNPELVERFWREARAAVKIQSEHVARVMDIGELPESGTPYIVMEYLEGDDLENIVKTTGPLPIGDAIRYLLQACEALAEVHAQGMIHRDIKPANLFIATRPDGSSTVKLLDFGITKANAPAWTQSDSLTNTAAVIGSPRYMSPEQLRSSRDVDLRADVWALGVTLFELLGGKSPFARGTMPEVCASILKDEPQSLAGLRPGIPPALEGVIRRCLAKEPEGRYRNVAELAMALRPFGPHGIIDISIERVVGIVQISMLSASPPEDTQRRTKASTAPTTNVSRSAAEPQVSGRAPTAPAMSTRTLRDVGPSRPPAAARDPSPSRPPAAARDPSPSRPPAEPGPSRPPAVRDPSPSRPPAARDPSPSRPPTRDVSPSPPPAVIADASPARRARADEAHYLARIGPKKQIPRVAMAASQIKTLTLDHRCGFLLSLVDGTSTIEEILDVASMPRIETLRLICELLDHGVIALTP